jgi:hypothetical protein
MSNLFRPKIVTYTLGGSHRTPEGKLVTKDTPGAVRGEARSKKWYDRVPGQTKPVPLSESKEAARRMLNKLRGDAELAGVGLANPFEEHLARPLKPFTGRGRHPNRPEPEYQVARPGRCRPP